MATGQPPDARHDADAPGGCAWRRGVGGPAGETYAPHQQLPGQTQQGLLLAGQAVHLRAVQVEQGEDLCNRCQGLQNPNLLNLNKVQMCRLHASHSGNRGVSCEVACTKPVPRWSGAQTSPPATGHAGV